MKHSGKQFTKETHPSSVVQQLRCASIWASIHAFARSMIECGVLRRTDCLRMISCKCLRCPKSCSGNCPPGSKPNFARKRNCSVARSNHAHTVPCICFPRDLRAPNVPVQYFLSARRGFPPTLPHKYAAFHLGVAPGCAGMLPLMLPGSSFGIRSWKIACKTRLTSRLPQRSSSTNSGYSAAKCSMNCTQNPAKANKLRSSSNTAQEDIALRQQRAYNSLLLANAS